MIRISQAFLSLRTCVLLSDINIHEEEYNMKKKGLSLLLAGAVAGAVLAVGTITGYATEAEEETEYESA